MGEFVFGLAGALLVTTLVIAAKGERIGEATTCEGRTAVQKVAIRPPKHIHPVNFKRLLPHHDGRIPAPTEKIRYLGLQTASPGRSQPRIVSPMRTATSTDRDTAAHSGWHQVTDSQAEPASEASPRDLPTPHHNDDQDDALTVLDRRQGLGVNGIVRGTGIGRPPYRSRALRYGDGTPSLAQQKVLLAIKAAWGGNFFGADTWKLARPSSSWYGVEVDGNGQVIGLTLPACGIRGTFPAALGNLTSLNSIDLQGNSLRGSIPAGVLKGLSRLSQLYLSGNQLRGRFPWGELTRHSFSMLDLYGNGLTGTIPPSLFGRMAGLQSLSIGGGNNFSGAIPTQFNSTVLYEVDLSGCQLTGVIPPALASLSSLALVDLSGNRLTGPFPPSLSRIPYLVNLNLANNRLSGRLPATFSYGPSFRALNVAGNYLTGPLPSFPNLAKGCPDSEAPSCFTIKVTLDFSNNYFYGSTRVSVPLPGSKNFPASSKVCPQTDSPGSFWLQGNCLSSSSGCSATQQKGAAECAKFCGTGSTAGQCSGHGSCSLRDPSACNASSPSFTCVCSKGYAAAGPGNTQCVSNSTS